MRMLGLFYSARVFILFVWIKYPAMLFSQFTITPTFTLATCPTSADGSIALSVSGGSPPYSFQWMPGGQTTAMATGLQPGSYSVTITDASANDTTLTFLLGPFPIEDHAIKSCVIKLEPTGGTPPYSFLWNTGNVSSFLSGGRGEFSVIITDANGCSASFAYLITEKECFVQPDPWFTPNGDGINDKWHIANSQYFENARVIVFDRWGTRVHEQKGLYEPWDGKSYLGIPVPAAVYYYFFFHDRRDKQAEAITGSVTIIR